MANDAKRFDDMKPRIRRDNARFEPMRQVVVDVKPLDCVMLRPNGTEAYPKLIAFQDTGTMRVRTLIAACMDYLEEGEDAIGAVWPLIGFRSDGDARRSVRRQGCTRLRQ